MCVYTTTTTKKQKQKQNQTKPTQWDWREINHKVESFQAHSPQSMDKIPLPEEMDGTEHTRPNYKQA